MTLFPCFQISLTTPTQIAHPELKDCTSWTVKNLTQDRCETQATHQATQNNDSKQAKQISNKKNKWWQDFSYFPHKLHKAFSTNISRLSKLILVAILFSITFQVVKSAEGKTLHLHNLLYTEDNSSSRSFLNKTYRRS